MEHWFDELSTLSAFFSNSSRGTRDSRLCLTRNCILWRLVLRRKVLSTYSLSWRGELSPPPSQSLILISPRDWRGTKKGVNHYSSLQCWTLYISFRIHEVFLFEKGRSFVFFSLIEIEVLIQRNECGRKRREICWDPQSKCDGKLQSWRSHNKWLIIKNLNIQKSFYYSKSHRFCVSKILGWYLTYFIPDEKSSN